jgi:peptidoglycan/xylan/chitin deacetylase (PgdA/CDA1 family)
MRFHIALSIRQELSRKSSLPGWIEIIVAGRHASIMVDMNRDLVRWAVDYGLRIADLTGALKWLSSSSAPIVLMYHGIVPRKPSAIGAPAVDREGFVSQMKYLKERFQIIHPKDLEQMVPSVPGNGRRTLALTFDDGLGSNATIARPILEEMGIPAIFFVSTRHLQPGKYLWFMHARALFRLWPTTHLRLLGKTWELGSTRARDAAFQNFLEETPRISAEELYQTLAQYPVEEFVPPEIIEAELRGMTETELAEIAQSRLIVIGNHTCNHPYLSTCASEHVESEIRCANAQLERICGRAVTAFAYPAGDYDAVIASQVKQAGFKLAFAVAPRLQIDDARMAIPRAGIYRMGQGILAAKSYGLITR